MKYSCYYIIHLGCLMGFTMHFYIIFGTNLLTQSPVPVSVFPLFQCFAEKEYQTESKRNETFGRVIFGTEAIQKTWSVRKGSNEEGRGRGGAHPLGAPSTLVDGSGLFWPNSFTPGASFGPQKIIKKLARQLDSVWYSFSAILKNKEKTETGTGLWVNRLVPKII